MRSFTAWNDKAISISACTIDTATATAERPVISDVLKGSVLLLLNKCEMNEQAPGPSTRIG